MQLPDLDPCPFCDVIAGRSDRWSVLEQTDLTVSMLNGRQYEAGQCIVVPTRHAPTIFDLAVEEEAAVMAAARRLSRALVQAFDPDGVLLYQNNGVGSGQEVPHFHLHVVPRRPESDWGFGPPHIARLEPKPHLDVRAVTEAKVQTAAVIRRAF